MGASVVFFVSLGLILYILIGYPAIVAALARLAPAPVQRNPEYTPHVTVILPVRDGKRWIAAKLENLAKLEYPRERFDLIVISDGSVDGTDALVQAHPDPHIRFVRISRGGKAAALNEGIKLAKGEILFLTDVRQPLDPKCLRNLTASLADPRVGAVSGELILLDGESQEERDVGLYWRYEKQIRKNLSAVASVFGATGAIYAIRRELTRPLPPHTLDDDVYLPLCAILAGYRVVFEQSAIAYDYPTMLDSEYRRKVRTLAGIYQLVGFFPALLLPGTPGWFHFISHKFGRLLLPWLIIAVVFSSWWLPQPLLSVAIGCEVLALGLVLIDRIIPGNSPLKRLTSTSRTFFTLMAATTEATSIAFRPANSFWTETRSS